MSGYPKDSMAFVVAFVFWRAKHYSTSHCC